MNEKEIASIIRTLKAYYPYYYRGVTAEEARSIIDVWKIQFKDFSYDLIKKAVDEWGGSKTTPPSIAELKQSIFNFYREYDTEYSRLIREGADPKEIERVGKLRDLIWSCNAGKVIR